jgi:hypothetical protein
VHWDSGLRKLSAVYPGSSETKSVVPAKVPE